MSELLLSYKLCVKNTDLKKLDSDHLKEVNVEVFNEIIKNKKETGNYYPLFEFYNKYKPLSLVKLFLDIDKERTILDELDPEDYLNENIGNIKKIIEDWLNENIRYQENFDTRQHSLINNFVYTYSNDPKKYSFHIYFQNIYVTPGTLKNNFKHYIKKLSDRKNIDYNVYNKITLRCPYSKKDIKDYDYVHLIPTCKKSFEKYNFSITEVESEDVIIVNDFSIYSVEEYEDVKIPDEFTILIKYHLENELNIILEDFPENIKCSKDQTNQILLFEFNMKKCNCPKHGHKNSFFLAVKKDLKCKLSKYGNNKSCEIINKSKLYKIHTALNSFNANRLLILYKYIILTSDNILYVWDTVQYKWIQHDQKSIIKETHLLSHLSKKFDNLIVKSKKDLTALFNFICIELLNTKRVLINNDPFLIGTNNGVFNLLENKFYKGDDCRFFYITHSVGYDYIPKCDMDIEEMLLYDEREKELLEILDKIQDDNEDYRIYFDKVLASTICGKNKAMLCFFVGNTCAGKSTLLKLLEFALGDYFLKGDNGIIKNYENCQKPSPASAAINFKRVVSISEFSDEIEASTIKKLTETYILARDLYSNKIKQENNCIYIIDTNHIPHINNIDNAILRRITAIKFDSFFEINNKCRNLKSADCKKVFKADLSLNKRIEAKDFSLVMINYLIKNYLKYHSKEIELEANIDLFEIGVILNIIKVNTVDNLSTINIKKDNISSYKFMKDKYFIEKDYFLDFLRFQYKQIKRKFTPNTLDIISNIFPNNNYYPFVLNDDVL